MSGAAAGTPWRRAAAAGVALLLAGCAAITPQPPRPGVAADTECLASYAALDAAVEAAGVRDAENHRLPGYPALRVNRLLAAQAPAAEAPDAAWSAWIERLRALDEADRRIEAGNLPAREAAVAGAAIISLARCSRQLAAAVQAERAWRPDVLAQARVPDRYSTASRSAGLYALTRWPFAAGVRQWEDEARARLAADAMPAARVDRLVPGPALAASADTGAHAALFARHAPVLEIEREGDADRIGMPAWGPDGRIGVDTTQPVVYERLAQTLVQGRVLTQLVYAAWFPERPARGAIDLLAGRLDGIVLRLTLAPDGTPWMLDSIHPCGCWHQFFPAGGVQPRPGPGAPEEWAFVPVPLPPLAAGERLAVTLSAHEHQIVRLRAVPGTTPGMPYARLPEDRLRALPWPNALGGGTRSLYGPDGLVDGTERGERFLFWPMGIASAGAMRQWGHHATAFVGRRHFDDADLMDLRFVFPFAAAH